MIAVILCVITGARGRHVLPADDVPRALYVTILLMMALIKFVDRRVVLHAPAYRPSALPAVLRDRVRSGRSCCTRSSSPPCTSSSSAVRAGGRVPRVHAAPRRLPDRRADRRRLRHRAHPSRPRPRARRYTGRDHVPEDLLRARRARDLPGVRVADPRPRRGLPVLDPHGAAPDCTRCSRRRCSCSVPRRGWPGGSSPRGGCSGAVRSMSRFVPAIVTFNLVIVITHWPAFVDLTLRSAVVHFLAHTVLLLSAFLIWMPILSPLPEIPRLAPISRMVFLFLQTIVPDGAGLVSHLRAPPPVSSLRDASQAVGDLGTGRSADRRPGHEDRRRTPADRPDRRDLLPLGRDRRHRRPAGPPPGSRRRPSSPR